MAISHHHRPSAPTLLAAFWMLGAVSAFSIMAVSGREAGATLDTFEIMAYRSLIGVLIVCVVARMSGTFGEIKRDRLGLHLTRNACHFAGQNLWFLAITMIPLGQLVALEFSYPIWVVLAAPLLLGERLTPVRLGAAFMGFLGILIVVRPGFETINAGTVSAMLCAVGFAGSAILTKKLTRDQSITCIMFWMTVMQAGMGLVCAGIDGHMALPTLQTLPWVILIGCCGLGAHFCLTNALALAPATIVAPLDFARLPVVSVLGALIYGETLDPFVFLGAGVIFSAIYIIIASQTRHRNVATSQP